MVHSIQLILALYRFLSQRYNLVLFYEYLIRQTVNRPLKVTLNSCAHAQSTCHEYFCIAGNGNGVRGSVVFWCSKICEQRQQASYFFMLGKLYDHWRRA